jgi:hypothetical protein
LRDIVLGQDFTGAEVTLAAEVEILEFILDAFQGRNGFEDLDGFGGDFGSGSIAAHDGDTEGLVAVHDWRKKSEVTS